MVSDPTTLEEIRVFPRLVPTIGLLAALVPSVVHAQVNIDQGKPASQIFANDCAACHKATRGLATGKNSVTLAAFLREHYTASREQAAALAAYVLGAGGAESLAPKPGQKPGIEHARIEEPKVGAHPAPQAAKPEGDAPASAKLQPPAGEEAKPEEPAIGHEARPATATRGHKKEPESGPPAQEPSAIVTAPPSNETPNPEASSQDQNPKTSAAAPAESQPGEGASVPRDNIPD
jgi:hypothetical protein